MAVGGRGFFGFFGAFFFNAKSLRREDRWILKGWEDIGKKEVSRIARITRIRREWMATKERKNVGRKMGSER
jgi:hypothetical protein